MAAMEGRWIILARVLRVAPAHAVDAVIGPQPDVAMQQGAGLEDPDAVFALQAILEQLVTDVDRMAAAAAAEAEAEGEGRGVVEDFTITVTPPARVSFLTARNTSHPDHGKPDMSPYIIATGSFCFLARFSTGRNRGTNFNVRPRASHLVVVRHFRNGANGQIVATAERITSRTRGVPVLNRVEGVGFLCNDNELSYTIAELRVTTGRGFRGAVLVCYRSVSGLWFKRELDIPEPLRRNRAWVPHGTVAVNNTIIWYDLSWGMLTCDDLGADGRDGLEFYELPSGCALGPLDSKANIHTRRCIALSGNFLRYVEIIVPPNNEGGEAASTVSMWCCILVGDNGNGWQWQWRRNFFRVSFQDIWNDPSYNATGLQNAVPDLVCISPVNPNLVYFSREQRLFSVDVPNHTVLHCVNYNLVNVPGQPRQASARFIVPWHLQPGLLQDNIGHVPEPYVTLPEDEEEQYQDQDLEERARRSSESIRITEVVQDLSVHPEVPYVVTHLED